MMILSALITKTSSRTFETLPNKRNDSHSRLGLKILQDFCTVTFTQSKKFPDWRSDPNFVSMPTTAVSCVRLMLPDTGNVEKKPPATLAA